MNVRRFAWFAVFAVGLLFVPGLADAQVCNRGKPCGNTCIARDRTCRVGPGTARAGSPSSAPARPPTPTVAAVPAGAQFVASSRGRVYYWTGCSQWRSLSAANLRWFSSRAEVEAAGYTPSQSAGCAGPADAGGVVTPSPAGTEPVDAEAPCTVATVVDGDTLDCADGRRIRLLLIDAPETSQQPFGAVAKAALERLAPAGSNVAVEIDVQLQDQYQRLLAYLRLEDGRIVNEELLRLGVAVVSVYPPNVRHVERFRTASEEAQATGAGLWSLGAFECLPADHRAGRCEVP